MGFMSRISKKWATSALEAAIQAALAVAAVTAFPPLALAVLLELAMLLAVRLLVGLLQVAFAAPLGPVEVELVLSTALRPSPLILPNLA